MKWCVERASGSVSTTIMCCANSVCMRTVCVCVCVGGWVEYYMRVGVYTVRVVRGDELC